MPASLTQARAKLAELINKDDSATGYADLLEELLELLAGATNELGTAATADTGTSQGEVPVLGSDGVLPAARLGTGGADSTKVLYGDGTWKDEPSGSDGVDASGVRDQVNAQVLTGEGIHKLVSGSGASQTLTLSGEDASDTNKGILQLATNSDVDTGTDNTKAVTPNRLKRAIDRRVEVWARDGTTDVPESKIPPAITRDTEIEDFAKTSNSGRVPVAKLGTGTAGTTRFLRGDGSWHTPPAGSGGGGTPVSLEELSLDSSLNVVTGSTAGVWTNPWTDLVTSSALGSAGVVRVFAAVHGEVTTDPSGGGDRVFLEMRIIRRRGLTDTILEDTYVYIRNTGDADTAGIRETSGKFGFPLAMADDGQVNDVYKLQVKVMSQIANRTVRFDTETKIELVTGGGGLSQSDVDARVQAGVLDWAEAGNTDDVPNTKLPTTATRWPNYTEVTGAKPPANAEQNVQSDWDVTNTNSDAFIRNKPTIPTIPGVATTSTDGLMASSDKTKLDGVASGAEVNVQSDWNATSGDAQILNKPTITSGLDQAAVDARVQAGVADWAEHGDSTDIPESKLPDASATSKGIVELATSAETRTGTDTTRAVTPDGLDDAIEDFAKNLGYHFSSTSCEAWIRNCRQYKGPERGWYLGRCAFKWSGCLRREGPGQRAGSHRRRDPQAGLRIRCQPDLDIIGRGCQHHQQGHRRARRHCRDASRHEHLTRGNP